MKQYFEEKTVGGVAAALPEATHIFRELGIDFCCGGHRLLSEVIREKGLDEAEINNRLELAYEKRRSSAPINDFAGLAPCKLVIHIEDTHHGYLREALPVLGGLLTAVLKAHGRNHPELFEVYRLFGALKTDLEQHLIKEETLLFPLLSESSADEVEITRLTGEITAEHEAAGETLRALRRVTNNYTPPADACPTFRKAYSAFTELEGDLFQHIHLENNVLLQDYHTPLHKTVSSGNAE